MGNSRKKTTLPAGAGNQTCSYRNLNCHKPKRDKQLTVNSGFTLRTCPRAYTPKFECSVSHRGSIKAQYTGLICPLFPKSIFIPSTALMAACSGLFKTHLLCIHVYLMLQNHICMCRVCASQRIESFQFEVSWNVLIGTQVK